MYYIFASSVRFTDYAPGEQVDAIDFEISCAENAAILYWNKKSSFDNKLNLMRIEVTCHNLTTDIQVRYW